MRSLVVVVCLLALPGCLRSDELRADNQTCQNYGFKDGSPEMAQCRMNLDLQRQGAASAYMGGLANRPVNRSAMCQTYGTATYCQ